MCAAGPRLVSVQQRLSPHAARRATLRDDAHVGRLDLEAHTLAVVGRDELDRRAATRRVDDVEAVQSQEDAIASTKSSSSLETSRKSTTTPSTS